MTQPVFKPGFRLSLTDALVLIGAAAGVIVMAPMLWWAALILGMAVLHFFLFCNVFRISRKSEMIWALVFTALSGATIFTGSPGWNATVAISVLLAVILIAKESRARHYHGIFWSYWNPGLPAWWASRAGATIPAQKS
jgi:uncharacterized membrane protein